LEYPLAKKLRLTGGADLYGRSRSKAYNQYINFDGSGNVTETIDEYPYTGGKRTDSGLFLSLDYEGIKNLDITGGLRLDFLNSRANPGGEEPALTSQDQALTGFLAASYRLFNQVSIFANYSRAYRAPDLNERFYTGITGRGFIIANPDLKNECSQNFDTGIKLTNSRIYLGLFGFIYRIDNLVERYKIGNQLYTYGNVEQGKIKGLELEWEYFPFSRFSVFGNYYLYDGQSQVSGNPLNDIPPQRLVIGGKVWFNRFNIEVNGLIQAKKGNPGPAEIAIPGYGVVNFKASYILNQSLRLYARINNLFNKFYLARPDPDSREEPRRNLVLGLSFSY
jgi:outer membrane receptor protein involved in Fe transport